MAALRPQGLPPVSLARVAASLSVPLESGQDPVQLTGVALDSREVRPGDLYAALPGFHTHGAHFATEAAAAGATAVLTDPDGVADASAAGVPLLVVEDPRAALGPTAPLIYDEPGRHLQLLGVTGTNGKTTLTYMAEAGLRAAGRRTGLIGTIETRLAGQAVPSVRTTPEAADLQALLAVARERGVQSVAMEVSSHALSLHRVDAVPFAAAVFTNLSQDHLDFHGDMEQYYAAKASLFRRGRTETAVICVDDDYGRRLAEQARVPHVTYSVAGDELADWTATVLSADGRGTRMQAEGPAGESVVLRVPLPGTVNVANALGALAALTALGVSPDVAAEGIATMAGVPGRMEIVEAGQPATALVDYAHTPQAVTALLSVLRGVTPGRLVVVLGCGGDRDRAKRPLMGRAALEGADLAVFTSDNPRSEDPAEILTAMTGGLTGRFLVVPDRAGAITQAVAGLGAGDTIVVAGKGHETGQEISGVVHPFVDRDVLAAALRAELGSGIPA